MRVKNARELGLLLRQGRKDNGWSQQEFAARIGASRHWVIDVERGKATAEMGLVLKALSALGMTCDIRSSGPRGLQGSMVGQTTAPDLKQVLVQARGRPTSPSDKTHGTNRGVTSAARAHAPAVPVPDLGQVLTRTTGKRIGTIRFRKPVKKRSRAKNRGH